jgi:hypothetical protein
MIRAGLAPFEAETVKTVDVTFRCSSTLLKQCVNERRGVFSRFFTSRLFQESPRLIRAKFGDIWCRKFEEERRVWSDEGKGNLAILARYILE